jgi:hypothetical protein
MEELNQTNPNKQKDMFENAGDMKNADSRAEQVGENK